MPHIPADPGMHFTLDGVLGMNFLTATMDYSADDFFSIGVLEGEKNANGWSRSSRIHPIRRPRRKPGRFSMNCRASVVNCSSSRHATA
jgi:hypothetical protein